MYDINWTRYNSWLLMLSECTISTELDTTADCWCYLNVRYQLNLIQQLTADAIWMYKINWTKYNSWLLMLPECTISAYFRRRWAQQYTRAYTSASVYFCHLLFLSGTTIKLGMHDRKSSEFHVRNISCFVLQVSALFIGHHYTINT
jgi:hypothetical protein